MVEALGREIGEGTGWWLERVVADLGPISRTDAGRAIREVDYIVTVAGDVAAPRIEEGKHDGWAWIDEHGLDLLRVSRRKGDVLHLGIQERAFEWLAAARQRSGAT